MSTPFRICLHRSLTDFKEQQCAIDAFIHDQCYFFFPMTTEVSFSQYEVVELFLQMICSLTKRQLLNCNERFFALFCNLTYEPCDNNTVLFSSHRNDTLSNDQSIHS